MMPEMMTPKSLGNPATEVCPPMYFFRQENIAAKAHKNGWPQAREQPWRDVRTEEARETKRRTTEKRNMLRLVLLELRDVVFRMSLESWTLWIVIPTMEKKLEDVGVKKRKQQANNPHCGRKFSGA